MDLNKNTGQQNGPIRPNQGQVMNEQQAQTINGQQIGYQQDQNQNMCYNNGYAQTHGMGYQQNGYQQNTYQKQVKQHVTYNNVLDKTGNYGMNLMVYVIIGCALFMCNATTALIILFAAAFVMEKDNELTKVLATLVILGLVFTIGYNVIYNITTPISKLGYSIMDSASYGDAIYNIGDWLSSSISSIRTVISWVFDIGLIVIGAIEFNNVRRGTFKVPKLLANYFN